MLSKSSLPIRSRVSYWCALLALVLVGGCAGVNQGVPGTKYVVVAPRTPFYRFGPMQNQGPDAMLELGQVVTLVSREYGYSRFMTAQGVVGYGATNDFAVATKPRGLPPLLPRLQIASNNKRRSSSPGPTPVEKKLDLSDLPAPEMPTDGAQKPGFRAN